MVETSIVRTASAFTSAMVLLFGISGSASAATKEPIAGYRYAGGRLHIQIESSSAAKTEVFWQPIDAKGKRIGREQKKRFRVSNGENHFELRANKGVAHSVRFRIGKQTFRLIAHRGSWSAGPTEAKPDQLEQPRGFGPHLALSSDIMLARGFEAKASRSHATSRLVLSRQLAEEGARGIPVAPKKQALVLVAKGDLGAVHVELAERKAKGVAHHRFPLELTSDFRRYVIPLSSFRPALAGSPRSIFQISLRGVEPAVEGSGAQIDFLGLTEGAIRTSARSGARGAVVRLKGDPLPEHAELHFDAGAGEESRTRSFSPKGSASVDDEDAKRFWVCYYVSNGAEVCDPPDAPKTTYLLHPSKDRDVVVEQFDSRVPVNTFRRPVQILTSRGIPFVQTRKGGYVALSFTPERERDTLRYRTRLGRLPKGLNTLDVELRSRAVPAGAIEVTLWTAKGRPRVRLADYVTEIGGDWHRVAIPLAAFASSTRGVKRRVGSAQPRAIELTMRAVTPNTSQTLELREIKLGTQRPPLIVASFDGHPPMRTSLGGGISTKGQVVVAADVAGVTGKGLGISTAEKGGGRVTIDLGRIDAAGYTKLTMQIKGATGSENAVLSLEDARRTGKTKLADHGGTDRIWTKLEVPLSAFGGRLRLGALSALTIELDAPKTQLSVDDIAFE